MADFREQRAPVKFWFLLGKSWMETLEILRKTYKDDAMGTTQVFLNRILNQSNNHANGKLQIHLASRKLVRWNQTSKQCWFVFSTWEESSIENLFRRVRQLARLSTWMFWKDWATVCGGSGQICGGRVTGFSIMAMPLLTQPCLYDNFGPKMAWPLFLNPHTLPTLPRATFFVS